tara:strand:+ start:408 stop:2036 length:1629 start_codon:yes stop_codon:yes gene_type:complete
MNCAKGPATQIRRESTLRLVKEFDEEHTPQGAFWDNRTYTDSSGKVLMPYVFSKTLAHDPTTGFPCYDDVETMKDALRKGTKDSVNAIQQSGTTVRKLEGVISQNSYNLIGTDSSVPKVTNPSMRNVVDSEAGLFEMAEVYSSVVLRDVSFADIAAESAADNVPAHLAALNKFNDKTLAPVDSAGAITGQTWSRGNCEGETKGPYVSQLLYKPFKYGNLDVEQKYNVELDPEAVPTMAHWLKLQDGENPLSVSVDANKQYVWNPRVMGSIVHSDPLFQFYYNAALICFQNGIGPTGVMSTKSSSWVSGGGPDVFASVSHVALGALRCAWQCKYNHSLKIRPEVYAQRLELIKTNPALVPQVPGLSQLKTLCDNFPEMMDLAKVKNNNQNILLNNLFPEGSPTHPSHPAGHAVVAWACITVLKTMLDTHNPDGTLKAWPVQAVESLDGTSLTNYTGADAGMMTVNGELNKLANNVSIGRDFAGVHYRADATYGCDIGEQYAISYMVDKAKEYHESQNGQFGGFTLHKCNGQNVKITKDGVENC